MKLRTKLSHGSITIFAVLVACASPAAILLAGKWTPYTPPHTPPSLMTAFGQQQGLQPVQMAFSAPSDSPIARLDSFDSFGRPALASRGLISIQGFDPRMFIDQVATHEIELRSAPDELANVTLAAEAIDGRIIAPYDTFSFNDCVGERSEDRGFRPGLMFSKGEVVSGVGGGVCIVSTALYDDVTRAGYRIIERSPHSGIVRYAEPGLDAAVAYGCLDMKFKNDTPYPVMIRAGISDNKLTVSLYSKKEQGLTVELARQDYTELPYKIFEKEDPAVPDGTVQVKTPARVGFEATMVRTIKLNGTLVKQEVPSHDRVPPRNKIVLIPPRPAESGAQPSPPTEELAIPSWTMPTHETSPGLEIKLGIRRPGQATE